MLAQNPYARYRQIETETADGLDLVIMLYRGAIRMLGQAEDSIKDGTTTEAHNWLVRVQDIINELSLTLNLDAGEVAVNLRRLYDYMLERLVEANVIKDIKPVIEVRELLNELLDAWLDTRTNVHADKALPAAMAAA
ncbi:MAG: flagellar export chaperone FliS [Thermomicrobiales bacterium]